jgi:hypothetical protein
MNSKNKMKSQFKMDEQHLVQLSIICQLLDSGADISQLNPNIQKYLQGMADDLNEEDDDTFDSLYYYADTFFNIANKNERMLH